MKTHSPRIAAATLVALLACPVAAQEASTPRGADVARLEQRIAALEARIAALEAERGAPRPDGDAIARVAWLADRAMERLVEMVRRMKRDPRGETL